MWRVKSEISVKQLTLACYKMCQENIFVNNKIKQTNSLVELDLFVTDFRLFFVTPGSLSSGDL